MELAQKDLEQMLETAMMAARLAGQLAMRELESIKVSIKNNDEIVTQADAKCQQVIIDTITKKYPDHGFIAEEGEHGKIFKQLPKGPEKLWWAIDPIDGTNNFAHKMLLFTQSIALMHAGEPVVGVVYEPATEVMFTAVKGGQAKCDGKPITTSDDPMDLFSSIGLDSNFDKGMTKWAIQIMQSCRFRNIGTTALQLSYVGKGALIGSIASHQKLWDIAAGSLICQTAGAIVTDWKGNKLFPIDLDNYTGQKFCILTANKKNHDELVKILNS
jgi:myo-inositol-1(or 4)-monophosphatase